jgi:hypothetical protein
VDIEDYPAEKKRKSKPKRMEGKRPFRTEEDLRQLILELSAVKGEFSLQDISSKAGVDEPKAEKIAQAMMDAGLAYEPSPGRFKPLSP